MGIFLSSLLLLLSFTSIFFIISIIFLKFIFEKFSGYNKLFKVLKKVKGNDKEFMNFGYWTDKTTSLSEANTNLCDYLLKHGNIEKGKRILDVGCGYGEQDFYIHSKVKQKINCLDINEKQINHMREKIKELGLTDELKACIGNAINLPFDNKSFDTVFSIESAFHYKPRVDFFKEVHRVLKPKGKLIIADIVLDENLKNITIPIRLCQGFFDVPRENLINKHIWTQQIKDAGFEVKVLDITNETFVPYFDYFVKNFSFNNFIYDHITDICKSYILNHKPFNYVVAVAVKK